MPSLGQNVAPRMSSPVTSGASSRTSAGSTQRASFRSCSCHMGIKRLIPMWHEHDLKDARWVEPAEVRELAPLVTGDDILGATFCPRDGIASPHAVTLAYAGAGRRL